MKTIEAVLVVGVMFGATASAGINSDVMTAELTLRG